jgi:death on curing protein
VPRSTGDLPSRFLSKRLVLAIHRDLIERFGGEAGLRDEGLLDSALAQPEATFGGKLLHANVHDQAAAYLFHLSSDHPFVDGNKRVAFAAMDTFLRLNGHRLTLSDEDAYGLTIGVAEGKVGKTEIAAILKKSSEALDD